MTNEEIIGYLDRVTIDERFGIDSMIKASAIVNICKESIEKQIPKKPIDIVWDYGAIREFKCPTCKAEYYASGIKGLCKGKHCEECGQKLDWGESE